MYWQRRFSHFHYFITGYRNRIMKEIRVPAPEQRHVKANMKRRKARITIHDFENGG